MLYNMFMLIRSLPLGLMEYGRYGLGTIFSNHHFKFSSVNIQVHSLRCASHDSVMICDKCFFVSSGSQGVSFSSSL